MAKTVNNFEKISLSELSSNTSDCSNLYQAIHRYNDTLANISHKVISEQQFFDLQQALSDIHRYLLEQLAMSKNSALSQSLKNIQTQANNACSILIERLRQQFNISPKPAEDVSDDESAEITTEFFDAIDNIHDNRSLINSTAAKLNFSLANKVRVQACHYFLRNLSGHPSPRKKQKISDKYAFGGPGHPASACL